MFYLRLIPLLLTNQFISNMYLTKADYICIQVWFFLKERSHATLLCRLRKSLHNNIWNDLLLGQKVAHRVLKAPASVSARRNFDRRTVFCGCCIFYLSAGPNVLFRSCCCSSGLCDGCLTPSLSPQTRPLVCVRLLCCHVHQRRERSKAGWGEDGGGGPWCVVGPGAVCIHRYRGTLIPADRNIDFYIFRHPNSGKKKNVHSFIQTVLFYISGRLELREDTIESLLSASCLLQLSAVVQACCSFLMKQLHPSNCLGIRSYADAQGCRDLQRAAHAYTMVGKPSGPLLREEHSALSDIHVACEKCLAFNNKKKKTTSFPNLLVIRQASVHCQRGFTCFYHPSFCFKPIVSMVTAQLFLYLPFSCSLFMGLFSSWFPLWGSVMFLSSLFLPSPCFF